MISTTPASFELRARSLLNEVYRYAVLADGGKVFLGWSEEEMRGLLAERMRRGRIALHRTEGKIDGLITWFRVPAGFSPEDGFPEDDDQGGELFIGSMEADNPEARKALIMGLIRREPDSLWLDITAARARKPGEAQRKQSLTKKFIAKLLK